MKRKTWIIPKIRLSSEKETESKTKNNNVDILRFDFQKIFFLLKFKKK